MREAHDGAVDAAVGYLGREAGEVRRGKDGVDRLPGGGFVAAAFRHRTSRAGNLQMHTHVLVANMTRGADGRQLSWQAKTAGTLYQAALRHELRGLGLRFVLRDNGLCELADVPQRVLRAFSRRRVEIEAELARRGESSPAGRAGRDPGDPQGQGLQRGYCVGILTVPAVVRYTQSRYAPGGGVQDAGQHAVEVANRLGGDAPLDGADPPFDVRAADGVDLEVTEFGQHVRLGRAPLL